MIFLGSDSTLPLASARLVDLVFPEVAVRQWVLSFPWPLRLFFTGLPDALSRRCLPVIVRAFKMLR